MDESTADMFSQYDVVVDNDNEDLSTIIVRQLDKGNFISYKFNMQY